MGLTRNIGLLDLIDYLDNNRRKVLIVFFLLFSSFGVFSEDNYRIPILPDKALTLNDATGEIDNLIYKTIKEVQDSEFPGKLIDMYFPNKLIN
jgi:hypothetical protein